MALWSHNEKKHQVLSFLCDLVFPDPHTGQEAAVAGDVLQLEKFYFGKYTIDF